MLSAAGAATPEGTVLEELRLRTAWGSAPRDPTAPEAPSRLLALLVLREGEIYFVVCGRIV